MNSGYLLSSPLSVTCTIIHLLTAVSHLAAGRGRHSADSHCWNLIGCLLIISWKTRNDEKTLCFRETILLQTPETAHLCEHTCVCVCELIG